MYNNDEQYFLLFSKIFNIFSKQPILYYILNIMKNTYNTYNNRSTQYYCCLQFLLFQYTRGNLNHPFY